MKNQKAVVHLRVYSKYGNTNEIATAGNRILNDNQLIKLTHNTLEWKNFIKNLMFLGYVKVVVEKLHEYKGSDAKDVTASINDELKEALALESSTMEEKSTSNKAILERLEKLEAENKKLKENQTNSLETVQDELLSNDNEELEQLRADYLEKFGKEAHKASTIKSLKQKLK